jgi:hypothetical protein
MDADGEITSGLVEPRAVDLPFTVYERHRHIWAAGFQGDNVADLQIIHLAGAGRKPGAATKRTRAIADKVPPKA